MRTTDRMSIRAPVYHANCIEKVLMNFAFPPVVTTKLQEFGSKSGLSKSFSNFRSDDQFRQHPPREHNYDIAGKLRNAVIFFRLFMTSDSVFSLRHIHRKTTAGIFVHLRQKRHITTTMPTSKMPFNRPYDHGLCIWKW